MGSPYIGEIRMFGGNFAPEGWAFCDGAATGVAQNGALFNLISTTYGGDGVSTFKLPDLRGRVPVHQGTGANGVSFPIGSSGGSETVALTTQELPAHTHALAASNNSGSQPQPENAFVSKISTGFMYTGFSAGSQMNAASVSTVGNSQPHANMMPTLTLSFIIALEGIYPSAS